MKIHRHTSWQTRRILLALVLCSFLTGFAAFAATRKAITPADPVTGLWLTEDKDGIVELYPCEEKICGRFYWLKDDSTRDVSRDTENPDPAKRNRPLCRMQFMGGFTLGENGRYNHGWIYSPRSGSIYTARMTLKDHDTLDLHGYVLTPFLGESQIWIRAVTAPTCITGLK